MICARDKQKNNGIAAVPFPVFLFWFLLVSHSFGCCASVHICRRTRSRALCCLCASAQSRIFCSAVVFRPVPSCTKVFACIPRSELSHFLSVFCIDGAVDAECVNARLVVFYSLPPCTPRLSWFNHCNGALEIGRCVRIGFPPPNASTVLAPVVLKLVKRLQYY